MNKKPSFKILMIFIMTITSLAGCANVYKTGVEYTGFPDDEIPIYEDGVTYYFDSLDGAYEINYGAKISIKDIAEFYSDNLVDYGFTIYETQTDDDKFYCSAYSDKWYVDIKATEPDSKEKKYFDVAVNVKVKEYDGKFDIIEDKPNDETETIKIGMLTPLSGNGEVHGRPVYNGTMLAVNEINSAGGINGQMIELIPYDTEADIGKAMDGYFSLTDDENVVAIIGGTYSGTTLAFSKYAAEANLPVISPTATDDAVAPSGSNVFRATVTDKYMGEICAAFAIYTLDTDTPAVLYCEDDPYSAALAEAYIAICKREWLKPVVETYSKNDTDYSEQLQNIRDSEADVLFLPYYTSYVGPILIQIKEMEMDIACIGTDGCEEINVDYADAAEGFYFANHFSYDDTSEIVQSFISSYEEEYDDTPSVLSAKGYDAVYILAAALELAGTEDSSTIVDALAITDIECVTGHITFDAYGNPESDIAIIQVVDGEYKLFDKINID